MFMTVSALCTADEYKGRADDKLEEAWLQVNSKFEALIDDTGKFFKNAVATVAATGLLAVSVQVRMSDACLCVCMGIVARSAGACVCGGLGVSKANN